MDFNLRVAIVTTEQRETTDTVSPPFTPARIRHGQRSPSVRIALVYLCIDPPSSGHIIRLCLT